MAVRNKINASGYGTLTAPQWAGKEIDSWDLLPGGSKLDDAAFTAYTASVLVKLNGAAAAAAQSLTVDALSAGIPAGISLNFGGGKTAFVIAPAAGSATTLVVAPLVNGIADNDEATFTGQYGKAVSSGTFVGRTLAERASGSAFGPAVATDEEFFLTAHDATDITLDNDIALVLPGKFVVKENFLPNYATLTAGLFTVTMAAAASAAATSLTVVALPGAVAAGTALNFGNGRTAMVITAAAAGATTLAIAPLPVALGGTETATVGGLLGILRSKYVCTLGAE